MKKAIPQKAHPKIVAAVSYVRLSGLMTVLMTIALVLSSCADALNDIVSSADVQPTGVAFFESAGGWDYKRIPLIEPYQAISTIEGTWTIDLQTDSIRYQFSVSPAKLGVIDKRVIITHGTDCTLGGEQFEQVWFVIVPEENIEIGFTEETKFLAYLDDNNINNPNLTDVDELYQEFVAKGCLEWFPNEDKE